ncbi:MAG: RNA polymerase sigma factor, partial [Rhodospirillales bacterium]|nr:RNA polymerase sigma factor [Rhodospirillales bacterium]
DDILQETFIRAYRSLSGFSGSKPLENWLSRIALRACYDHWRKEYRSRDVELKSSLDHIGEAVERLSMNGAMKDHSEKQNAQDAREVLNWALNQLAPADRMVLTLTHLDGYSTQEAADMIGWTSVNVKVRAFRARNKLRSLLQKTLDKTG